MKEVLFLGNEGRIKVELVIQGDALVAYSMRLWKAERPNLQLMEEMRGSCIDASINNFYIDSQVSLQESTHYVVELGANINTTLGKANYAVQLVFSQLNEDGNRIFLGVEEVSGHIGFENGGKYKSMGVALKSEISQKANFPVSAA